MKKNSPHTIKLEELQQFVEIEYKTYASSTRERKSLLVTLQGTYLVIVAGETIHKGIQPLAAVEAYNSITDEHVPTH